MTAGQHGTVIVGASVAGVAVADALRKNGYDAPVRILDALPVMPHNRPPLSKQALEPGHDDARLALRPEPYFSAAGIDLLLGCRAVGLTAGEPTAGRVSVQTDGGVTLAADEVVLAPGAAPRRLPGPSMLPSVHVLRSLPDAVALRAALSSGSRVVIAGCGFIGAEVAAAACKRGLEVTVIESAPRPFEALVGRPPAAALVRLHRDHGVRLLTGTGVAGIAGAGRAEAVVLADGRRLPADVVVLGLGVLPAVDWLAGSGIALANGIICDRYGRTNLPGVHAVGDAAAWPDPFTGVPRRIEHWTTAQQQGAAVGHNIACPDQLQSVPAVPYFWSDQHGVRIQSLGWLEGADEIRCVHGDWDSDEFVALYRRGDHLAGALGVGAARQLMPWRPTIERRAPWSEVSGQSEPMGMTA
ncbi:MAG TPA: FAD-dependent oxidoreductase [Trebonia sp.]|jgi:NADPH-dependent 2,4-dienoyl-CoA reductase/sulfur reductase-like enzyme|nr:FAD-dependent oxidoreductase [Trebonia sp.]